MDHPFFTARTLATVLALSQAACTNTSSPDSEAVHEASSPTGDIPDIGSAHDASMGDDGDAAIRTLRDADAGSEPPGDASMADSGDAAITTVTDADAGSEPPPTLTHAWKATSARVRLTQFSYWTGGSRFENARDALTKDQLAALEGVTLKAWDGVCRQDGLSASLTIVDADGSEVVYWVAGKCGKAEGQVLDEPSLNVFLKTLHCLNAGETRGAQTTPATAPLLGANDGCEHGFFDGPPWLMLDVTKANVPYTVRGVNCQHNQVHLALYDQLGKTLLAEGSAEAAPGCQMLRYTFPSAGKYALELKAMGGDYFLKLTHD